MNEASRKTGTTALFIPKSVTFYQTGLGLEAFEFCIARSISCSSTQASTPMKQVVKIKDSNPLLYHFPDSIILVRLSACLTPLVHVRST